MSKPNYHLKLTGYVGGYDFDRQYVDYILAQNEGKPVNVLIDSLGGSLATALSIASAFQHHGDVTVHFVGMNASAATIASLGAKHVSMDASAMYLAHKCSTSFFEWGSLNSDQLQNLQEQIAQMQTDLDKMDANVAQMYAAKCKDKNAKEVLDLMKVGGWLSAKEALEWGFVDEITEWQEAAPILTDTTASAMSAAGIPLPNIPVEGKEDGAFQRFLSALTAFFTKPSPIAHAHNTIMKKIYALVGALLAVEAFAMEDGKTTLTEAQLQSIEDELKKNSDTIAQNQKDLQAKDDEINRLTAEVEALKKKPAEDTTHVVNNGGSTPKQEKTDAENYIDTINSARALFNDLP